MIRKILLLILLSSFLIAPVWATDWTNPTNGCLITALFDEGSGDAADSCGTATDGTTLNVTYGVTGVYGDAYSLAGDGNINFGSDATLDDQEPFSLVLWLDIDSTNGGDKFFTKGTLTSNGGWGTAIVSGSGDTWKFGKDLNGTDASDVTANDTIDQNAGFQHFAATWDGNNGSASGDIVVYLDGEALVPVSETGGGAAKTDAVNNLAVGNSTPGDVDEFGFFNVELDSTDITDIYTNGLAEAGEEEAERRIIFISKK